MLLQSLPSEELALTSLLGFLGVTVGMEEAIVEEVSRFAILRGETYLSECHVLIAIDNHQLALLRRKDIINIAILGCHLVSRSRSLAVHQLALDAIDEFLDFLENHNYNI